MQTPAAAASDRNQSMWQLAIAATKASSGSTALASVSAGATTLGEAAAAICAPPSKSQRMRARCSLMRCSAAASLERAQAQMDGREVDLAQEDQQAADQADQSEHEQGGRGQADVDRVQRAAEQYDDDAGHE